eukprot:3225703-Pyramimonas_sp.AAC.1
MQGRKQVDDEEDDGEVAREIPKELAQKNHLPAKKPPPRRSRTAPSSRTPAGPPLSSRRRRWLSGN